MKIASSELKVLMLGYLSKITTIRSLNPDENAGSR